MIIHQPWEGKQFRSGLNGQRVGIVGYSHWNGDPDRPDSEAFTQNVVNGVIRWDGHNFFTQIRNYFQFDNHHSFWQRVLFFNYARNCIGEQKDRYKSLRKEKAKEAARLQAAADAEDEARVGAAGNGGEIWRSCAHS